MPCSSLYPSASATTEVTRHILIDVGNVLSGRGGDDSVFKPVIEDVRRVVNNQPVDLYVMTHEHMDHIQGLPYAAEKLGMALKAQYAWLTASAEGDAYYNRFPNAKKKRRQLLETYDAMRRYFAAAPEENTPWVPRSPGEQQPAQHGGLRQTPAQGRGCGQDDLRVSRVQPGRPAPVHRGKVRDLGPGGRHQHVLRPVSADGARPGRGERVTVEAKRRSTSPAARCGRGRVLRPG